MLKEFHQDHAPAHEMEEFLERVDHHSDFFKSRYFNFIERVAGRTAAIRSNAYNGTFTMVTGAEMAMQLSEQPELFSNAPGSRVVPDSLMPQLYPSDIDGSLHQSFRRFLNPLFAPKPMREIAKLAAEDAAFFIAEARRAGKIDFVTDLGQPVTGRASMRILGLPVESWADFSLPVHNITFSIGSLEQRMADGVAFGQRVKDVVASLMDRPDAPGLIGHMVRTEIDGERLTQEQIESVCLNVIIGGLDTTQAAFSSTVVYLGRNPDRLRELALHPERIRSATSEFLRVFSSAGMTGRRVEKDVSIDGYDFRAGETALIFWGAANFDPSFVDQPFTVSFTRGQQRTLTFASGPHRCLGQQLAKLELEMLIEKLVQLESYQLIEDEVVPAPDVASVLAYMNVPAKLR